MRDDWFYYVMSARFETTEDFGFRIYLPRLGPRHGPSGHGGLARTGSGTSPTGIFPERL